MQYNNVSHTDVKGASVNGCRRFKKDIMVTLVIKNQGEGATEFVDIFLTNEQAESLVQGLQKRLKENAQ